MSFGMRLNNLKNDAILHIRKELDGKKFKELNKNSEDLGDIKLEEDNSLQIRTPNNRKLRIPVWVDVDVLPTDFVCKVADII